MTTKWEITTLRLVRPERARPAERGLPGSVRCDLILETSDPQVNLHSFVTLSYVVPYSAGFHLFFLNLRLIPPATCRSRSIRHGWCRSGTSTGPLNLCRCRTHSRTDFSRPTRVFGMTR